MINNFILRCMATMALTATSILSIGLSQVAFASTEVITYYHNDISGTPMIATDANGNGYWKETYLAYGIKLTGSPNASSNKIGYAGKPYDNNTRLSYMGARYYSPDIGRFMAVDPVGFDPENVHSFNRYAYANNNPYKYVDPDGHSPVDVAFLVYDLGKLGVAAYTGVGVGAAAIDVGLSAVGVLSPIPGLVQGLRKTERVVERTAESVKAGERAIEAGHAAAKGLPDSALVCRGGACKADNFSKGSGVTQAADGTLNGVSTQSRAGASVNELAKPFKNNQVGVTTVGDIRAAGGRVTADGHAGNPNHATVDGLSAKKLEQLFSPTIQNPVPSYLRGF